MLVKVFMYSRAKILTITLVLFPIKTLPNSTSLDSVVGCTKGYFVIFHLVAVFDRCVFMPILLGEFLFQQMFYFIRCYIV